MYAANQPENLRLLIGAGANVNAWDSNMRTPLHWAVNANNPESVRILLEAHAYVNARNNEGETALSAALKNGRIDKRIPEMLAAARGVR